MVANIYDSRHYKLLVLVPLVLLFIGLYFIPRIQLDSSLRGGINIQLQTNATINARQLTQAVDAKIPGAQSSVSASPGGVSITIATNSSLAGAETRLLEVNSYYSNYSSAVAQIAAYQSRLATQPSNTTLQGLLANATALRQRSVAALNASLGAELQALAPLIGRPAAYNSSSADSMLATATGSYSTASSNYESTVLSALRSIIPFSTYSYNSVTATLGSYFLSEIRNIIIVAFVLLAITVLVIFRNPIPSLTVVFGAGNDILIALGAMGAFGIPLGVASIGGILMLIGYSMDTDILTAIRILKRTEGSAAERAFSTLKTGTTMTTAAILSFLILFIVSYVTFIPTYFEISGVVLVGLFADLATTWLGNATLILWYRKRQEARL